MEIRKSVGIGMLIAVLGLGAVLTKQSMEVAKLTSRLNVLENELTDKTENIAEMKQKLSQIEDNQEKENEEIQWIWEEFNYPGTPETLLETLKEENDSIPFDGVLGGTPFFIFEQGQVLDAHYVYMPIEDGHMVGAMLLKYEFLENGRVKWTIIDGWWPSMEEN